MAFPVTINGRTYTLADFEGTNYVDGFPDALEDFVTQAGDIYNSTSTSSVAIGTGSKSFTTADSGKPYQPGTPLRIADAAAPGTNFMDCIVTSYSGTSLVVDSIGFGGSGTKSSWTINIGGAKTVDGTLAVNQGGTGATTASAAASNLGLGTEDSPTFSGITTTGDVNFGDNDKAIFGAGSDLQIYHDGTASRIVDTGTGSLKIQAENFLLNNVGDTENMISAIPDGAVSLFYNGSAKLATTDTGIDVTGTVTADGLTVDGDSQTTTLKINTGSSAWADTNADDLIIRGTDIGVTLSSTGTGNLFFGDGTGAQKQGQIKYDHSNDSMQFSTAEAEAARFNSSGNLVFPNGQGIDFSASEVGGAPSSVLDDYERGSFTPTLTTTGTVDFSYQYNEGYYVKIGALVYIQTRIRLSSLGSSTGSVAISSLPFTVASRLVSTGLENIINIQWDEFSSSFVNVFGVTTESNTIEISALPSASAESRSGKALGVSDLSATSSLRVMGVYNTAQ